MISYKRKAEELRLGGISSNKKIKDFDYTKLNFNDELINYFNKMQKIYVLDDENMLTIDDIKNIIRILFEIFKNL